MNSIDEGTFQEAVHLLLQQPRLSDYDVVVSLVARGVGCRIAARLVEFVPMAYTRHLLDSAGVCLQDAFYRPGIGMKSLSSEPIWRDICRLARTSGLSSAELLAVAGRSAEFQAVNDLANQGSLLENIALVAPRMIWLEDGPSINQALRQ